MHRRNKVKVKEKKKKKKKKKKRNINGMDGQTDGKRRREMETEK